MKSRVAWPVTGILLLTVAAAAVEVLTGGPERWALGAAVLIAVPLVAAMGGPPSLAQATRPPARAVIYRLVVLVTLVLLGIRAAVQGNAHAVLLLPFVAVLTWRLWLLVARRHPADG